MVGKTHLAVGLAAGVGACIIGNLPPLAGVITIAEFGLGALLPDIDQRNSTINKVTKPIGLVTNIVIGHRETFHDPTFYIAFGALVWLFVEKYMVYVLPILLGVATHLFLDALNPSGIPVLGFRLHLCNIHTGSSGDLFLGTTFRFLARIGLCFWIFRYLYQIFTGGLG